MNARELMIAMAVVAACLHPAAAQQFNHAASLPDTPNCNRFKDDILPHVDSEENMEGLNHNFRGIASQGPNGEFCRALRARRSKDESDPLRYSPRNSKEKIFIWGNLCGVDTCNKRAGNDTPANQTDDTGIRQSPSIRQPSYLTPGNNRRAGGKCAGEEDLRSINSNQAAGLAFFNSRSSSVRIYWIDFQGVRKFYTTVAPGATWRVNTYLTHPWVITDLSDQCIATHIPQSGSWRVTVR